MADHLGGLIGGEHLGLGVEGVLELAVVHADVACGNHQHRAAVHQIGERLGDARGLHVQRLGGQLHGGAGDVKFLNPILHIPLLQIVAHALDGHVVSSSVWPIACNYSTKNPNIQFARCRNTRPHPKILVNMVKIGANFGGTVAAIYSLIEARKLKRRLKICVG